MKRLMIRTHLNGGPTEFTEANFDMELTRWVAKRRGWSELKAFLHLAYTPRIAGASGTLSNYAETAIINHVNGKTAFTMPATVALALTTAVPDSSKTGATITEANYTGYARVAVAAATFNAATAGGAGSASTTATNAAITFPNCTAGSSTIVGWGLLDSATLAGGNMLWWGSATSTVISTTQTPPTIASGGLTESLL